MFKFNTYGNESIQENLKYIGSLQNSLMAKIEEQTAAKRKAYKEQREALQESQENLEMIKDYDHKEDLKTFYENRLDFLSGIDATKTKISRTQEFKKDLLTESFNKEFFSKKITNDLKTMKFLFENYLPNKDEVPGADKIHSKLNQFLENSLNHLINLHEETNVKSRYSSLAMLNENMTEEEMINVQKVTLNKILQENFVIPNMTSEFNEEIINESKSVLKYAVDNNIEVNEKPEDIISYMHFEESVRKFVKGLLLSETSEELIHKFIDSQDEIYIDLVEENASVLLENFNHEINKLVTGLAPFMYDKIVVQENSLNESCGDGEGPLNPFKLAGLTAGAKMVCMKVNDGPMHCTVEKTGGEGDDIADAVADALDDAKSQALPEEDGDEVAYDGIDDEDDINDVVDDLKSELEADELYDNPTPDYIKDMKEEEIDGESPDDDINKEFEDRDGDSENDNKSKKKDKEDKELKESEEPQQPSYLKNMAIGAVGAGLVGAGLGDVVGDGAAQVGTDLGFEVGNPEMADVYTQYQAAAGNPQAFIDHYGQAAYDKVMGDVQDPSTLRQMAAEKAQAAAEKIAGDNYGKVGESLNRYSDLKGLAADKMSEFGATLGAGTGVAAGLAGGAMATKMARNYQNQ